MCAAVGMPRAHVHVPKAKAAGWIRRKGSARAKGQPGPATLGHRTGEDTLWRPSARAPHAGGVGGRNSLKVNLPRGARARAGGGVCVVEAGKASVKFQPLMTLDGKVPRPWERRRERGRSGRGVGERNQAVGPNFGAPRREEPTLAESGRGGGGARRAVGAERSAGIFRNPFMH